MRVAQHHGLFIAAIFLVTASLGQTGCSKPAMANATYGDTQFTALQNLVSAASMASIALSGEDFAGWEKARPGLGKAINDLGAAFGPDAFNGLLSHALGGWPDLEKAADIAHARAAYLKVSDNIAQIVLVARKNDPRLASAIVYYCSMTADPANARWVQTAPPLSNPFWGVAMADCCREVKP